MSEDMSDRMPEDLPVRKCINVMVGITRSKVIFFKGKLPSRYWHFLCHPVTNYKKVNHLVSHIPTIHDYTPNLSP
jgi:hypothetical protein